MYQVIELESNLPADIADALDAQELEGWSVVSISHDVAGVPRYVTLHKAPEAPKPPEGRGVTAR
jgi:hypothetical protein